MERKCSTCGYIIKNDILERCPRCYTIIVKHPNCNDCKGCSIKGCNFSKKE